MLFNFIHNIFIEVCQAFRVPAPPCENSSPPSLIFLVYVPRPVRRGFHPVTSTAELKHSTVNLINSTADLFNYAVNLKSAAATLTNSGLKYALYGVFVQGYYIKVVL
jgi:hypothetical protein